MNLGLSPDHRRRTGRGKQRPYRPLAALAVLAALAALVPAPAAVVARSAPAPDATPSTTPPERCLALQAFPVPAGDHPHDVAPAADGKTIWYTAQAAAALGLLDPATGKVERIPLGNGSAPHGVIVGPDGAAWVTDGGRNAIVRVDPGTHAVKPYPLPIDRNANLNTAAFDRRGVLWFTGQAGFVGRLDPARGVVEVVPSPRGAGPYGITATPDGNVYFASLAGSYLGRLEDVDNRITVTELNPPTPGQGARRVWSDSRGVLWVSEWNAGQVARYDPRTGTWREWRLPGDHPQPYAVYVDARGDVWLSDFGANALVRFDPDTETFVRVPLPDPGAAVRQLNGRPGELWGAESSSDKIVVVRSRCG